MIKGFFNTVVIVLCSTQLALADYSKHPVAKQWASEMQQQGFSKAYLDKVLKRAKKQNSILKAMARPAEKRLSWDKYRDIFIETKRIQNGNKFWQNNKTALARAEREFGVPAQVIVSIIGVETRYGKVTGSYRVLDALATIAFDHKRRGKFFQNELKEFLLLSKEEKIDYTKPKGSYAGAMGYGQFIPSSFRAYAIDYNGDGKRDIWRSTTDAIGSVANYLAKHGWRESALPAVRATMQGDVALSKKLKPKVSLAQWKTRGVMAQAPLDDQQLAILINLPRGEEDQFWFGLQNFYVITRYNRSRFYAMAVFQLSELIKAEYGLG